MNKFSGEHGKLPLNSKDLNRLINKLTETLSG